MIQCDDNISEFRVLTEDEIVEQVEAEAGTQVLIDNSDDDQDEQLQQRVSHGEACQALETLLNMPTRSQTSVLQPRCC